jgi:lysophospholipase L1-like esterase
MAAGPGIRPRAAGAPRWSGRSARNYAHLIARRYHHDLVDVTFSGATTEHVLTERQHGAPPQIAALDGTERLVTVTIGGNDVGYIPLLMAAALPRSLRHLPLLGGRISELLDRRARDRALDAVFESLCAVGRALRQRSARARIFFVDYLTVLPPPGVPAAPLSATDADLGRHVAATLETMTADAATATGCELIRAGAAGREHHAWSAEPWTTLPARLGIPVPCRPAPLHPNAAGMRAVADLIAAQL